MIDRIMVKAATEELPGVTKNDVKRSDFERAFTSSYGMQAGRVLDEQYRMGERSEEHTSELQSLMRTSYAVFCLTQKSHTPHHIERTNIPSTYTTLKIYS